MSLYRYETTKSYTSFGRWPGTQQALWSTTSTPTPERHMVACHSVAFHFIIRTQLPTWFFTIRFHPVPQFILVIDCVKV